MQACWPAVKPSGQVCVYNKAGNSRVEEMEVIMDRTYRISEEMKKEVSSIIQNDLKDPRLPKLISVMSANVTKDLRYAKIFISVLGNEEEKKNALQGLKSAAGFIRREIGHRMQLRYTPEMIFELDTSIEHGVYITKLINDTMKNDTTNNDTTKNK